MPTRQPSKFPLGNVVAAAAAISLVTSVGFGFAAAAIADHHSATSTSQVSMNSTMPGGMPGGGSDTMNFDYSGSYSGTQTADGKDVTVSDTTVESTKADTNALLAENGGTLTVSNATITKSGDSSNDDNTNFYGTNAGSLTVGSSSTTSLDTVKINTDAEGANAVFATDSGTVLAKDITIATTGNNSRGFDATYGGTIIAGNVTSSTQGDHSATVATDRGGGSVSVTDAKLSTAGSGSPLLYSTGNIQVNNVTGTASGSQIAGMEGMNTILIANSQLTSTITGKTASDPVANGIIIYQSTSGDAEASTGEHATFQAANSTLSSAITEGSMFYLTNTTADVVLSKTKLDFDSSNAMLITAAGNNANNWGTQGSNGADVTFTGRQQTLDGNVSVDAISTLTLNLLDSSQWTGTGTVDDGGDFTVNVDGSSTWTVTKDTTVSNLNVASGGNVVDSNGKTVTIVANGTTVVQGDGDVTVTVSGSYSTTVSTDESTELSDDLIDRSAYDSEFNTSSAWTMQ